MLKQHIESWALQVIDRVVSGQPNEDALSELKTDWPDDFQKAARRLAGHANAARNQNILWLIGVDEKAHSIPGASHAQFADWMAQLASCFGDGVCPTPTEVNISHDGKTVVAIAFATDRPPYVVKNPSGGAFQRDVPWREGTRVDSATRRQLLGILLPALAVPKIEPVVIEASMYRMRDNTYEIQIDQQFFFEQPAHQTSTIPIHRCLLRAEYADVVIEGQCREMHFIEDKNASIDSTPEIMVCSGSGYFRLHYINHFPMSSLVASEVTQQRLPIKVLTRFETATDRHVIDVTGEAAPAKSGAEDIRWQTNRWPTGRESAPSNLLVTL